MDESGATLHGSQRPLVTDHDLVMLDLDGVVYISGHAVDGAAVQIDRAREAGSGIAFVTNNASRTPQLVAAHLRELGVNAVEEDVVTSAQAAAHMLADRFSPGSPILVLGAHGLVEAVRQAGLSPVSAGSGDAERDAVAVVTGYGPDVVWKDLMRTATRIRSGLPWVASNTDMSIPTDYGIAPGHGVQVAMLADFTGVEPPVAGKPSRPLLDETIRRVGGERPLMVGDRLDTDIEGARAVGVPSLLVLTGVTGMAELLSVGPAGRPTYLHPDLRGLHEAHPVVRPTTDPALIPRTERARAECGGWRAAVDREGTLHVECHDEGEPTATAADWWRAMSVAAWAYLDRAGVPADDRLLDPPVPDSVPSAG